MRPPAALDPKQRQAYAEERAFWQRAATSHFEEADLPLIRWHQARLRETLAIPASEPVAEVGCGAGKLFREHAPGSVLLIDFSPAILARARRERPHLLAVCASVDALPFRDLSLDRMVANNMLHHVKAEGLLAPAAAELARVLKPGGRLHVNDRNPTLCHHAIILLTNAVKRLLRRGFGEFPGCGSFDEPLFFGSDWRTVQGELVRERETTYYSVLMWGLDALAKGLAVILGRERSFVARLQERSLGWLIRCERLPGFLHIERSVSFRKPGGSG